MALARRVAAVVPLVGAVTTAAALTGAAFLTVAHAGCDEAGGFVRTSTGLELVGGCVSGRDLPPAPVAEVDNINRFGGATQP
ncbi:hypothetical protein FKR81_27300 [Lentzea tibetensis]|uniref:Secreted protein n=1 Tax=Lentzea tibetensis TaxID=2591470 RepID=A0A563ENC6_9PSEU|nr:hypothetical protein [Lentzea tibetensis]TWP48635.1 hypothetical protein FKR81_27300 [Lentzea tibetensis]